MLRRLGTAGLTFALAMGCGYLVQNVRIAPRTETAEVITDSSITPLTADTLLPRSEAPMATRPLALPDLPATPSALPAPGAGLAGRIAGLDPDKSLPDGAWKTRFDEFGMVCPRTSLSLTPAGDGMMTLLYANSCDAGVRLIVAHDGIAAAQAADATGRAVATLPVLDAAGRVTVLNDMGEDLSIARAFDGATGSPRIVVGSNMPAALSLGSGKALPLGDGKAPMAWTQTLDDAAPVLRAAVTAQTCGQDLLADVRITGGTAENRATEVAIAMPDCSQTGQTVLIPLSDMPGALAAISG